MVWFRKGTFAARIFRVAATPRLRRGDSVETSRGDAGAWIMNLMCAIPILTGAALFWMVANHEHARSPRG